MIAEMYTSPEACRGVCGVGWSSYQLILKVVLVFVVLIQEELDIGAIDEFDHDLDGGIDLLDGLVDEDALGIVHLIERLA